MFIGGTTCTSNLKLHSLSYCRLKLVVLNLVVLCFTLKKEAAVESGFPQQHLSELEQQIVSVFVDIKAGQWPRGTKSGTHKEVFFVKYNGGSYD